MLTKLGAADANPLSIRDIPTPIVEPGFALLKVLACGICRTDLQIIEGHLPPKGPCIIPGHEIVAEVVQSPQKRLSAGMRVGVSWVVGTDGTWRFCRADRENLCDPPVYTHHDAYAEYELLKIAAALHLRPEVDTYRLDQVNAALRAQEADQLNHTAVLLPQA